MTEQFNDYIDDDLIDEYSDEKKQENLDSFASMNSDELLNHNSYLKPYAIRQGGAVSETNQQFHIFNFFLNCGGGRSTSYIAATFNLSENKVQSLAKKNNWFERASDYDIDMLQEKLKLEQDSRAIEHKKRLEEYRLQQEFLGKQMSSNASKLAALSQRTLDNFLANEQSVDIRDVPGLLNTAAKIAEVGKSLQSGALGVEQLLVALEEAEFDS
jgi:hypothetical protein